MKPITQEDIARKLNVTRITVSKALRGHPDISAAMKEKVLLAAAEMGYTPNEIARQLNSRTTRTIGVIVPDLENPFFSHVADSIIDHAYDSGYQVILAVSREKADIEEKNLLNLIGKRVDGLLLCASQQSHDPRILDPVRRTGIPLVFFDRSLPSCDFSRVVFDDESGVHLAIDQLVGLGYRSFAHFAGYLTSSVGRERHEAIRKALGAYGLEIREHHFREGGFEVLDGYQHGRSLLAEGSRPEVIIAVNDRVALGAYRAIREAGQQIPEDIAVVGFGFPETAALFSPTLAVISQDPRNMGYLASKLLIDEIQAEGPVAHQQIRVKESFIINQSVKNNLS